MPEGDVVFIICIALFLFGMYLFGAAFTLAEWQGLVFVAGLLCVSIAIAIPMRPLPPEERR